MLRPACGMALEAGTAASGREIDRLHSDSDSIGSKVYLQKFLMFANMNFGSLIVGGLQGDTEIWSLAHPDGKNYFTLEFVRLTPKLTYKGKNLMIKSAIAFTHVNHIETLYKVVEYDDQRQFALPSIAFEYQLNPVVLKAAGWQETDVQTFDSYNYTVFLYQNLFAGVDWEITNDHTLGGSYQDIERVYPEEYTQHRSEQRLHYRWKNPFEIGKHSSMEWREIALAYLQTQFPKQTSHDVSLSNSFKFSLLSLTHFVTHQLTYTDAVTTYREDRYKYTLIEENREREDWLQKIDYAGFTRIGNSSLFVAWKYEIEDSLKENTLLDQKVEIKLTYSF